MSFSKTRKIRITGSASAIPRPISFQPQPLLPRASNLVVTLTTAGSTKEASRLARLLVEKRVAACVNLLPGITSRYWWKGKVAEGKECLLLIKTHRKQLPKINRLFRTHHSYQLPELIALPILLGERNYLHWLRACLDNAS